MVNIESYIGYNKDGIKCLFVNAEFDENYIEGQSISQIVITYDNHIVSNGYPDTTFPNVVINTPVTTDDDGNPNYRTWVQTETSLNEIVSNVNVPHLYVVYVKIDNSNIDPVDLVQAGCEHQKEFYSQIVYDFTYDVSVALSMISEIDDCSCDIPTNYINKMLQISAIKFAIQCGDIEKAYHYFNRFFQKNQVRQKRKGCGCHG